MYTVKEFEAAREALANGYKHRLRVVGGHEFKSKVKKILTFIKTAEYYDFLVTYIRKISEIDGLSQLREADAMIWLNGYMVKNPFEGARFVIQKSEQMKTYLDGRLYYNKGENLAVEKSLIFLEDLRNNLKDEELRAESEKVLKEWKEARIM